MQPTKLLTRDTQTNKKCKQNEQTKHETKQNEKDTTEPNRTYHPSPVLYLFTPSKKKLQNNKPRLSSNSSAVVASAGN